MQKTRRPNNPRRPGSGAFTLVELLVVIGIIALLISILMPALSKAREQANAVKCMSNQRNLGNALVLFTQEHQGFLPKAWFNDGPIGSGISGKMTFTGICIAFSSARCRRLSRISCACVRSTSAMETP